jgi:WD40 repeat protein
MAAPCPAPGITAAVVLAIALAAAGVVIATQPPGPSQRGLLATLSGPRGQQEFSAAFSPDMKTLAVVTYDGVSLWDVAARRWTATLTAHGSQQGGVPAVFSPDGKHLPSSPARPACGIWPPGGRPACPPLHPDGRTLAVAACGPLPDGGTDGTIYVWDVAARRLTGTLRVPSAGNVIGSLAFGPGGTLGPVSKAASTCGTWPPGA